jgi:hypothetical protein
LPRGSRGTEVTGLPRGTRGTEVTGLPRGTRGTEVTGLPASGRVRSASVSVPGRLAGAAVGPARQISRWSHGKAEIF